MGVRNHFNLPARSDLAPLRDGLQIYDHREQASRFSFASTDGGSEIYEDNSGSDECTDSEYTATEDGSEYDESRDLSSQALAASTIQRVRR